MREKAIQFLGFVFQVIRETPLLYFFSALAQCAAGFAALVGVFAIFRLQANTSRIGEEYLFARHWLKMDASIGNADALTSQEVKRRLEDICAGRLDTRSLESAKQVLKRIKSAESFNEKLVYKVSRPLRYWAIIFIGSLSILPLVKWIEGAPGALVITLFLAGTTVALIKTGRFVQQCLDFK